MTGIEIIEKEEAHTKWGEGFAVRGIVYSQKGVTTAGFFAFYTPSKQIRQLRIDDHQLLPILLDNLRTLLNH
ncbi:hypothetical protein DUZ99_01835 [Xylanibacillus composti]|jgi:hypothetical protein|nr:hypothetical protein [Xylanibacillus composti]